MSRKTPVAVALLALNLIGLSLGSPLPHRLNHSSSSSGPLVPLSPSSSHPLSHSSRTDSTPDSSSSPSRGGAHSEPSPPSTSTTTTTANAEQVDRVQLLSSPWEPAQFNLPFSVSNSPPVSFTFQFFLVAVFFARDMSPFLYRLTFYFFKVFFFFFGGRFFVFSLFQDNRSR